MKILPLPSIDRLNQLFIIDAVAGVLTAKTTRGRRIAGTVVGTPNDEGRLICRVDYKIYYVHRILWKMYYGCDPVDLIDHGDRKTDSNGIRNLRDANISQNGMNRRVNYNTKSGLKGAHWSSSEGKWRSSIKKDGKSTHLGWFKTKEDAHAAYKAASKETFGEFSCS